MNCIHPTRQSLGEFQIKTAAPESVYSLLFDSMIVLDSTNTAVLTTGTDKDFTIGWPTLEVTDGHGFPGSTGNLVQLNLESGFETGAIQLDILFDTSVLSVSRREKTEEASLICVAI